MNLRINEHFNCKKKYNTKIFCLNGEKLLYA